MDKVTEQIQQRRMDRLIPEGAGIEKSKKDTSRDHIMTFVDKCRATKKNG